MQGINKESMLEVMIVLCILPGWEWIHLWQSNY